MPDENEPGNRRFDSLDQSLIAELQETPRLPYAALGARLGVSGMTVANRLTRLREEGLVQIQAIPALDRLGLPTRILGLVQVETGAIAAVADLLRATSFVLRADRVTGEFDISFEAAFPSEQSVGRVIGELQAIPGVRRLVVHHYIDDVHTSDGWEAVFEPTAPRAELPFELAPGVTLPHELVQPVHLAASWVNALTAADAETLSRLSQPGIVFTIEEPHPAAGTFTGIDEVQQQAVRTRDAYQKLWYRIVAAQRLTGRWNLVIDALSPVETRRGRVRTAFSRMAFGFSEGKVARVRALGAIDLPDTPRAPASNDFD